MHRSQIWGISSMKMAKNDLKMQAHDAASQRSCGCANTFADLRATERRARESTPIVPSKATDTLWPHRFFPCRRDGNRICHLARNGYGSVFFALVISSTFPMSCSRGPPQVYPKPSNSYRDPLLLSVPCPEVLGTASAAFKRPKPKELQTALLARALPEDLILKRHGIDVADGIGARMMGLPADLRDKTHLVPEAENCGLKHGILLRGSDPDIFQRSTRIGSADWSMSEEEYQHRSEDVNGDVLDFATLRPPEERELSATAAAAAVAAAAANMEELKLVDKAKLETEVTLQPLELECAWRCIPHPLKVARGGEDVHMICRSILSTRCCTRIELFPPY